VKTFYLTRTNKKNMKNLTTNLRLRLMMGPQFLLSKKTLKDYFTNRLFYTEKL